VVGWCWSCGAAGCCAAMRRAFSELEISLNSDSDFEYIQLSSTNWLNINEKYILMTEIYLKFYFEPIFSLRPVCTHFVQIA